VANDAFDEEGLRGLPEQRRSLVTRLATGAAFVAPVVASWDLVSSTSAAATATSNTSNSTAVVCVVTSNSVSTPTGPGCV